MPTIRYGKSTVEVTPEVKRAMRAQRRTEQRAKKERLRHEVNETDSGVPIDRMALCEDPGPFYDFDLLLGSSPTWDGPDACWLDRRGMPCRPGLATKVNEKGRELPRPGVTCRFCSHLRKMPPGAVCLNCCRSGRDAQIRAGAKTAGRTSYRPDPRYKGGTGA